MSSFFASRALELSKHRPGQDVAGTAKFARGTGRAAHFLDFLLLQRNGKVSRAGRRPGSLTGRTHRSCIFSRNRVSPDSEKRSDAEKVGDLGIRYKRSDRRWPTSQLLGVPPDSKQFRALLPGTLRSVVSTFVTIFSQSGTMITSSPTAYRSFHHFPHTVLLPQPSSSATPNDCGLYF